MPVRGGRSSSSAASTSDDRVHEFAPEGEESEEQGQDERHRLRGGLTAVQASGRLLARNKNRHRNGKDKGTGGGDDAGKLEEGAQISR